MPTFVLPLTVRTERGDLDLLIDLPAPTTWAEMLPEVLRCAGLPTDTVLNLDIGPVEGTWLLGAAPLLAGTILSTGRRHAAEATGPVNLSCVAGPDAGRWVALGDGPVIVGRDIGCDLRIDDPELSRRHSRIEMGRRGLLVDDLGSANGIRLDGAPRAAPAEAVPTGGLIRLGGSVLRGGLDLEPALLLTPDGGGHLAVARPARVAPSFDFALPPPVGPPPERPRRPLPLLAAAIAGLGGAAIAIVTGLWTFLLLAALGPVMMLTTALSDRLGGRRSHRREVSDHGRALARQQGAHEAAVSADRADAWDRYPDPATLARRARSGSRRLWERRADDPDFLRLFVGIGQRPARLAMEPAPSVSEVPITLGLGQIGVLGLAGDSRGLLRHCLGQLAVLHSPADLQLSVFSDHPDLARLRDLPHTALDGRPGELRSDRAAAEVVRLLSGATGGPITVVILDDAHRWRRIPRMNQLLEAAARNSNADAGLREHPPRTGVPHPAGGGSGILAPARPAPPRLVAICVADTVEALPVECTSIAVVRAGVIEFAGAGIGAGVGPGVGGRAEAAGVSAAYLEELVCAMAPFVDPDAAGAGLPPTVRFAELLGRLPGQSPGATSFPAAMASRWAQPSLRTAVGTGAGGPVIVDLERDGPHLLIAGTTGSGKSELLRTLIAGLALAAPPDRTAFLLIDYKGGAAFGRLEDLPHTAGVVTDLDVVLAARALSGLRAEVHRREQLLADHGVADLAGLRRSRKGDAPPSLVIVVDEFATLGAEFPEFLAGLLDVAQRGRSLGLHLVLATQRPAGVLSPAMKANIGLRIALRVTDDADSVDVIDTPEAARLGAGQAGRALLRAESSERSATRMFQVAMVSCAAPTGGRVRLRDAIRPRGGHPVAAHSASAGEPGPVTDLDRIIDAARAMAVGLQRPRAPWTPPLPVLYQSSNPGLVALLDEPSEQRQEGLPLPAGSLLLLGPPGSGRSSALRRLAWGVAHRGGGILVVDPGGSLSDLAGWPSTRTYLDGGDPTLVQRLAARLQDALRTGSASPEAPLLLIIDGWDSVSGALESLDYGATLATITDLAGRGPASGLQVAISGDLRMQHHRSVSAFTTVVRLGADERGEVQRSVPGRGSIGATQVQWAHAPRGLAAPSPPGPPAGPVIRPLPTSIALAQIRWTPPAAATTSDGGPKVSPTPAPDPAASSGLVPIGVGGDDGSVQYVDLAGPGGGFLIAGPRRSGVSTALQVLATGAVATGLRVVRGHLRPAAPLTGARDVDLRAGAAELEQLLVGHHGPILLVIDDLGDAYGDEASGIHASVSALLERFVTVAGAGQYLALGSRLDRALRSRRGPIAEVAAMRCGLLLQADSADGGLLDAVLPRRRGPMLPGRGQLIRPGVVIPIQVALP